MIPDRVRLAVELLEPQPGDAVLEVGCGRGVAAELILARLVTGSYTGIDRSDAAIWAAGALNSDAAAAGRARFLTLTFEDAVKLGRAYNRALAVNVNRFWLGDRDERQIWGSILGRGSRVVLGFETPPGGRPDRELTGAARYLEANGFVEIELVPPAGGSRAGAVSARWP